MTVAALWTGAGGDPAALARLSLTGEGNGLPSSFAVGALAHATIGVSGLAASELLRLRGGPAAAVEVPLGAAMAAFLSERLLTIDDGPAPELWDPVAGNYPAKGGWIRLHTNFPHHLQGVLDLLGVPNDRAAVAAALKETDAAEFEAEASKRGLCVALLRSLAEWEAHPQSAAVAADPPVAIERIGDAPPEPLPPAERPLAGLRVLDLTRIIAGPVAGRELAAHGADVLHLTAAHLPAIPVLDIDTGRGKRAAHLDLRTAEGEETFRGLLAGADVYLQGYRPGALSGLGFPPEEAARLRPGIVCASMSAYGETGPWAGRRGFDSLVQFACGINHAEAEAAGDAAPKPLPAQALDHGGGYLLAFGIQMALARRAVEGGSWHVRVSLAGTARYLKSLGRVPGGLSVPKPDLTPFLEESESPFGRLRAAAPAARIEGAMPRLDLPAVPLGTHEAVWA